MIGTKLAHFEITAHLGSGGMGDVYEASDSKLGRNVAVKFLPEEFAHDSERLARFEREARVLASLNHPNIAAIYGLEHADRHNFLVMELVDGETLADRIQRGAVPLGEALGIAKQIAEALEAAHESGIVHRDLKPANVKLRSDGVVKVLDFGLAKPAEGRSPNSSLSMSPTLSSPAATQAGIILGTAAYMSPEQARGKATDKRSDVWSFGCVLYEMLTGARTFEGEDVTDVIAAVVRADPDWKKLPVETPASIQKLLRRCLMKDRKERLPDIGTARLEIKDVLAGEVEAEVAAQPAAVAKRSRSTILAWAFAGIAAAIAVAAVLYPRAAKDDTPVLRTSLLPVEGTSWRVAAPATWFSISPNGRKLVFLGRTGNKTQLWVRPMDSLQSQPLAGTENAKLAFWSPDSRYIAFCAGGKLKKIDASGGPAIALADMDNNNGGAWSADDVLLFRQNDRQGLSKVSASGGKVTPVTTPDDKTGPGLHWQPFFLPDNKHFFYHATAGQGAIYLGSLDPAEAPRMLIPQGSNARYSQGYILFMSSTTLMAQRFNLDRLALEGEAKPVADRVQIGGDTGRTGAFSVSENGVLVYATGTASSGGMHLAWWEPDGKVSDTINQTGGDNRNPRLSPDGKRVAVERRYDSGSDIWVIDLVKGTNTRVTFGTGNSESPVWSPDGTRILYRGNAQGTYSLYSRLASGTGEETLVLKSEQDIFTSVTDWSADGKYILFTAATDIWYAALSGDNKKPQRLTKTPFAEGQARFSPDGKWVAYTSNESTSQQIYVVPFPPSATGDRVQISVNGGHDARWRGDGKQLFFVGPSDWSSVDLTYSGSKIDAAAPKRFRETLTGINSGDLTADGKRWILAMIPGASSTSDAGTTDPPIVALFNWTAALQSPAAK